MKEAILQWINSRQHYDTGVALYEAHGNDFAIKRMLGQGHSPFRQKVLVNALRAIAADYSPRLDKPNPCEPTGDKALRKEVPQEPNPGETTEVNPSHLHDPFRSEWVPLFVEMNTLRHQLRYIPTDAERAEAAVRILKLREQCKAIWERRDYFQRTGEMPPPIELNVEPSADPNLLQRRLNNVATYITKARKAVDADPTNEKKAAKLAQYLSERDSLLQRLNNNGTDKYKADTTGSTGGSQ